MQEVVILNKIKKVWRPTKKIHGPLLGRGPPVRLRATALDNLRNTHLRDK